MIPTAAPRTILEDNIDVLHSLSQALIERETLTGEEVARIISGEELPPTSGNGADAQAEASAAQETPAAGEDGFTLDEGDAGDKAGE